FLGGMLTPWGSVQWHESLAAEPIRQDLEAAIARFEQQVSVSKIKGESETQTRLESGVNASFFSLSNSGQDVMPRFIGAARRKGKVRLDLENPETGGKASFWIDLKTRKEVSAGEHDLRPL